MFDYVRVSCCVPAIEVADVAGNTEKIAGQLWRVTLYGFVSSKT